MTVVSNTYSTTSSAAVLHILVQYCIYYMFRLLNCHCHWHGLVMNSMDMHYSMLTWPILFSYLVVFVGLPFGIKVQLQLM